MLVFLSSNVHFSVISDEDIPVAIGQDGSFRRGAVHARNQDQTHRGFSPTAGETP